MEKIPPMMAGAMMATLLVIVIILLAAAFGALCTAVFLPGKINKNYAIASMIVGPVFVLMGRLILPTAVDPLFLGVGCSLLVLLLGFFAGEKETVWNIEG